MSDRTRHLAQGFAAGLGMHLLQLPVIALVTVVAAFGMGPYAVFFGLFLLMFSGTTQLLYMVPAIVRAMRRGDRSYASGLCCAGILLCAANIAWFVVDELRRPLP